jgi:hypothetical protein
VPVTVKGRATRAAGIGGKIKNSSTNCQKGPPGGFVCTTSAVVCP